MRGAFTQLVEEVPPARRFALPFLYPSFLIRNAYCILYTIYLPLYPMGILAVKDLFWNLSGVAVPSRQLKRRDAFGYD